MAGTSLKAAALVIALQVSESFCMCQGLCKPTCLLSRVRPYLLQTVMSRLFAECKCLPETSPSAFLGWAELASTSVQQVLSCRIISRCETLCWHTPPQKQPQKGMCCAVILNAHYTKEASLHIKMIRQSRTICFSFLRRKDPLFSLLSLLLYTANPANLLLDILGNSSKRDGPRMLKENRSF